MWHQKGLLRLGLIAITLVAIPVIAPTVWDFTLEYVINDANGTATYNSYGLYSHIIECGSGWTLWADEITGGRAGHVVTYSASYLSGLLRVTEQQNNQLHTTTYSCASTTLVPITQASAPYPCSEGWNAVCQRGLYVRNTGTSDWACMTAGDQTVDSGPRLAPLTWSDTLTYYADDTFLCVEVVWRKYGVGDTLPLSGAISTRIGSADNPIVQVQSPLYVGGLPWQELNQYVRRSWSCSDVCQAQAATTASWSFPGLTVAMPSAGHYKGHAAAWT